MKTQLQQIQRNLKLTVYTFIATNDCYKQQKCIFMKHILRLVNYYKNILLTITTNIFTFDVSVSIRDLH